MSYETILTEINDGVCIIRMNRPDRLNAWTYKMGGELNAAVTAANEDPEVLAIVLTGVGRGFCAGADIEAVFQAQADGEDVTEGGGAGDWVNLIRHSKPVVAAINGAAIGLGVTQVLPMDYLISTASAKLSLRFVKMGLVPELASSHFLFARLGYGHASDLMLTGRIVSGAEACELGLVDRVVDDADLLTEACAMARAMGENPQSALKQIKSLITTNAAETDLRTVQKREGEALKVCYASAEHREAIDAFMHKREPDFRAARATETNQ